MSKQKTSYHVFLLIVISSLILTAVSVHALSPTATLTPTITTPDASGDKLAELDEFASQIMGDPWDMEQITDSPDYHTLPQAAFTDGMLTGKMILGNGAERINLLSAGAPNNTAMRIGKIGYYYPINASHYQYLTLRLYKSCASAGSCTIGNVQWFVDDSYTTSGVQNYSLTQPAGWQTIVVDLSKNGNWSGIVRELLIHPFASNDDLGATVRLDWARLTHENPETARPYTMRWTPTSGTYDIYASPDNKVLEERDVLLENSVNANSGQTELQTGVLPAGSYYLAMRNTSSGNVIWSPGPLIVNDVPQIDIIAPSMTSGDDFAATVLGNAWDMNDVDINTEDKPWYRPCLRNEAYASGIYSAEMYECPSGITYADPIAYFGHMNLYPRGTQQDPLIDTDRYRYLSFRYRLSGKQDIAEGWVARFGWWQTNIGDNVTLEEVVMSRDILLSEGWNTYEIDLWANDIVDESHPIQRSWRDSAPNRLRFDPAELHKDLMPATFELDWIKLTAVEEINRGETYQIAYDIQSSDNVSITIYYDTDTIQSGRSQIQQPTGGSSQPPAGEYMVYLPLVNNDSCSGAECLSWNTSSISSGDYHVCFELDDGYNTVYRCSETTITVR